jgi:hypothetical protein
MHGHTNIKKMNHIYMLLKKVLYYSFALTFSVVLKAISSQHTAHKISLTEWAKITPSLVIFISSLF